MEKEKVEDLNENIVIGEEQLEGVDGGFIGIIREDNCYFEPDSPPFIEERGGWLMVRCKSRCKGAIRSCSCYANTSRCNDRMHRMDRVSPTTAAGHPHHMHNHYDPRKIVTLP